MVRRRKNLRHRLETLTGEDLWRKYEESGKDVAIRNYIVEKNINLVRYIAQKLSRKVSCVDFDYDDLVSFGYIGLMQAVERYDISLGYKFSTFASHRIRGSILDEIRRIDWIPRHVRSKIKKVKDSIEEAEQCFGCDVDKFAYAKNKGLTLFEYNIMNNNHICMLED